MLSFTLLSGIKLSMLLGNIAWIAMECRHFHYSNVDIYNTISAGKTHTSIDTIQSLLGKLDMYNKCIHVNKTRTKSYTKEFIYLFGGLSEDAIRQFQSIDEINECLQNPYAVLEAVELAAWSGMNISFDYANQSNESQDSNNTNVANASTMAVINQSNQSNQIIQYNTIVNGIVPMIDPSYHANYQDLVGTKFDLQQYQYGSQLIHQEFTQSANFKQGVDYLENLADPTNPDLAKKMLNPSDFKLYQDEMESNKRKLDGPQIVHITVKPSYFGQVSIIAGTIYELFVQKPSHTHLLDMINRVRDTITEYSRNMRNQYNLYNDLFYDTRKELERISAKSAVAWKRASWLVVNTGILALQLSEYIVDDIIPFIWQHTEPVKQIGCEVVKQIL